MNWVVGRVIPNREQQVVDRLSSIFRCESYFPKTQLRRRQVTVCQAAFSGYVFVREYIPELMLNRLSIGLENFLNWLSPITDETVAAVKKAEADGLYDQLPRKIDGWPIPGTPIRITMGPFTGFNGVVVRRRHGGVQVDIGRLLTCPVAFLQRV